MIPATSTLPPSTATLPSGGTAATTPANPSATLTQNDFLTLLTAQLENQNPLNPLSGADFAAELAQFSTASGVQGLQTGLSGLTASMSGLQAAGLVGHNVAVAGNRLTLGAAGATGAVTLAAAAKDVTATITDGTGKTVATLDLGPMAAGTQNFAWNGQAADGSQLPPGSYDVSVTAVDSTGAAVTATPQVVAPVVAVSFGGQGGPLLQLGNGMPPVPLTAVQQIL